MPKPPRKWLFAKRTALLVSSIVLGAFLYANCTHEKIYETLLLVIAASIVLGLISQILSDGVSLSNFDKILTLGMGLLLITATTFFLSVKLPEPRTEEIRGIALFSDRYAGPYLFRGFKFPHEFYWQQWKFGILLNAYYDNHSDKKLLPNFYRSWIVRAVTSTLSRDFGTHWLIHRRRILGLGQMWGPEDKNVKALSVAWRDVKGFAENAFYDVKVPVINDGVCVPVGGKVSYEVVDDRVVRIFLAGRYARLEIETEFSGAPMSHSPYPEWAVNSKAFQQSRLVPVFYEMRVKSTFPKWHWNLTSDEIRLEAKWIDRVIALLKQKFDEELFFQDLSEKITVRAAADAITRSRSIKTVDDPLLFNEAGP